MVEFDITNKIAIRLLAYGFLIATIDFWLYDFFMYVLILIYIMGFLITTNNLSFSKLSEEVTRRQVILFFVMSLLWPITQVIALLVLSADLSKKNGQGY